MMQFERRTVLRRARNLAALAAGGFLPPLAARAAAPELPFEATSLGEALKAIGGWPQACADVWLETPDLVENGAVVPVTVTSRLPDTREICIVAEANPNPLIVRFLIPQGTEPFVFTRIKLAESGAIHAVVRAEGGLYGALKTTQVTLGGCG